MGVGRMEMACERSCVDRQRHDVHSTVQRGLATTHDRMSGCMFLSMHPTLQLEVVAELDVRASHSLSMIENNVQSYLVHVLDVLKIAALPTYVIVAKREHGN